VAEDDGARTVVMIVHEGVELVSIELAQGRPDLLLVDALARLQLAVSRFGGRIHLRDPCPELCGLVELVGLATVLTVEPSGSAGAIGSDGVAHPVDRLRARELVGEAEGGEQRGVEEVVEPLDPPL
jgi:hypothetical protein